MKNRINKLLELFSEGQSIEVADLAERFGVSQVTIRKDLDILEEQGIIRREHGHAALRAPEDVSGRIARHYQSKKAIAKKAAELVTSGSTIMLESGSCCALFADALTECRRDLTIVTNSVFIADHIRHKSDFQIVLLGGIYQTDAQVTVGPMVGECASNFCVDTLFIGSDGYSERTGFTCRDQLRAQAVRDMACQAERVAVLAESEKFAKNGVVPFNLKDKIKVIITDRHLNLEKKDALRGAGFELMVAGE